MTENREPSTKDKLALIIASIQGKKGKQITEIDLTKVTNSICDYFVICNAESTTQVDAITDAVLLNLKNESGVKAHHVEGTENCNWVLIDYFDILVHIFQDEMRSFYNLEELWADGEIKVISEIS